MTHFRGTDFRSHIVRFFPSHSHKISFYYLSLVIGPELANPKPYKQSCVSEEQKYQGSVYKEKPVKQAKKSVKISEPPSQTPRKAYIEDVPDEDTGNAVAVVDAPPAAPSPPSAVPPAPKQSINVFDFLVPSDTPNASRTSLEVTKESVKIVEQSSSKSSKGHRPAGLGIDEAAYEKYGFAYGTEPVPITKGKPKVEFFTPAPKSAHTHKPSADSMYSLEDSERKSTDKKRKRTHAEDLELTAPRRANHETDHIMDDTSPPVLHSGLTGGLGRLLTKSKFEPMGEPPNSDHDPPSPVKRLIKPPAVKEKERGRKAGTVYVKVRKRRSSDESRPRKQHRSHHESDRHSHHDQRPKRKAIEYHAQSKQADSQQQLVLYKTRAELFSSFVTKGPESEQGYSLHKALKRYHRERGDEGLVLDKVDEERELFKALRLKRNDRGEMVVFF